MACCGDRRRSLTHAPQRPPFPRPQVAKAPNTATQQAQAHAAAKPAGTMLIKYVGSSRTKAVGPEAMPRRDITPLPPAALLRPSTFATRP